MTLLGDGAVAIWNDLRWAGRETVYRWHDEEHVPERVGVEGFLRGRRYIRIDAEVEWFTLYETETTAVLGGPAYLERLNNPTEWTRAAVAYFFNVTRGLTAVRYTTGSADGGNLLVTGYKARNVESAVGALESLVRDRLANMAGICAAHLCVTEHAASSIDTAERKERGSDTIVPDIVVLAESGWDHWLTAARTALDDAAKSIEGLQVLRPSGIYRLEFELRKCASPRPTHTESES